MTIEKLQEGKKLQNEIDGLTTHINEVRRIVKLSEEKKRRLDLRLEVSGYADHDQLIDQILPGGIAGFIVGYLIACQTKLDQMQAEFEAL